MRSSLNSSSEALRRLFQTASTAWPVASGSLRGSAMPSEKSGEFRPEMKRPTVDGRMLRLFTVFSDQAIPGPTTSPRPSGLAKCSPPTASANMSPNLSPVMSLLPTARQWTISRPRAYNTLSGTAPTGQGPLLAPDAPLRRGTSSADMEKLAHDCFDYRNGDGVTGKSPNSRCRRVDVVGVWEPLEAQHLAACKSSLAVHQQVVVARGCSKGTRKRVTGHVASLVLVPDSGARAG